MKKRKINLTNTVCKTFIEYYSFRPADNTQLYVKPLKKTFVGVKGESLVERIGRIFTTLPSGWDVYKMRLRYDYFRGKKRVSRKYTQFFYVQGAVKPKQEVAQYFAEINPTLSKEVNAYPGNDAFWIHYEVQPIEPKHNYELLTEPKKAAA